MGAYVFLDRDGTLIEDRHYTHRLEDYAPLPGAYAALRSLREAGYGIVIVTNQSGIGRGYFKRADYERFEAHLEEDFARRGARIDASYVCPHRPEAGCRCRKPAPGLIEQACRDLDVDLARSWVIGDKPIDVELARNAGCRAIMVLSGQGRSGDVAADVELAEDLLGAARRILAG
ncbi:MAG: D-glycero-alpha-D-manno-heptose-1,7-bisphosphate 7-phosphatase [Myxococcota bacterium]